MKQIIGMLSGIVNKLKNVNLWHLLWMTVIASEILTAGMSLLLKGRIARDYLFTGFVVSLIAATLLIYFVDRVTELTKNYDRLSRTYELILTSAGEGIFGLDTRGNITFANAAALTMLGYSLAEVIGKFSHSVWHHTRADLTPYPASECGALRSLRDGTTHKRGDEVFWRKDGSSFPVEYKSSPIYEMDKIAGVVVTFRDITEYRKAESDLQQANDKLASWASELEQRNREIEILNEMGSLLHSCISTSEAYEIIARSVGQLFLTESGAVYLLDPGRNILESIAAWGDFNPEEQIITPNECWAVRLGRPHLVYAPSVGVVCRHLKHRPAAAYFCIPMTAQAETLGVLHVQLDLAWLRNPEKVRERIFAHKHRIAEAVAEHIALSFANFKLRETLYNQSIHDPLTGLFNRRYMGEVLEKELHRMARRSLPLGIALIDIDHFKQFNDNYGHEAGDFILREFSYFLTKSIREEDFVCRYGGEEFVIIMPETYADFIRLRTEQLRAGVKQLRVEYHGRSLDSITISIGGAVFPEHGTTTDMLLRAADSALYQAKTGGRDQVVIYSG